MYFSPCVVPHTHTQSIVLIWMNNSSWLHLWNEWNANNKNGETTPNLNIGMYPLTGYLLQSNENTYILLLILCVRHTTAGTNHSTFYLVLKTIEFWF